MTGMVFVVSQIAPDIMETAFNFGLQERMKLCLQLRK